MNKDDFNHRMKNIAQVLMCLQREFDKLYKEVNDGGVDYTISDNSGDDGRTVL